MSQSEEKPARRRESLSTSEEVSGKLDSGPCSEWRRTAPTPESDGRGQTVGEILRSLPTGTVLAELVAVIKKNSDPHS